MIDEPALSGSALQRADESVATRFSRMMNATTSRIGILTDPPVTAALTAVAFLWYLGLRAREVGPPLSTVFGALAAAPIVVALALTLALRGARRRVVVWLSQLPFPLENVNAVLNGLGEFMDVTFAGEPPPKADLAAALEAVHPDAFVVEELPAERLVRIRIGVVDSDRLPAASNNRRYERMVQIAERVLVPMHAKHPIEVVRIKA